jgi:hypothetical protein
MAEIEPLHQFAYREGRDPIDHAVFLVGTQIETRDMIRTARLTKPDAFPIFRSSLTDDATARRILAVLMDAGWTPPSVEGRPNPFTEEPK